MCGFTQSTLLKSTEGIIVDSNGLYIIIVCISFQTLSFIASLPPCWQKHITRKNGINAQVCVPTRRPGFRPTCLKVSASLKCPGANTESRPAPGSLICCWHWRRVMQEGRSTMKEPIYSNIKSNPDRFHLHESAWHYLRSEHKNLTW